MGRLIVKVNIYPIVVGIVRYYLIKGEGIIMVDGGAPNKAKAFVKGIQRVPIRPEEIQLMVMTHGHPDHIGSASAIKDITGARIAMHREEKDCLERGRKDSLPGAWEAFSGRHHSETAVMNIHG